jgi:hypothetical protein
MTAAAAFLGEARGRLLPASIPMRYFGAAVAFHLLAWVALMADGTAVPGFAGGLGLPLAALHLLTLGVLVMTAIGASLQLLPVATRQPVASARAAAALWWLYTPGVGAAAAGMALAQPRLLVPAATAIALALAGYALLLARNLRGVRGMVVVVVHGWAALVSLGVVLASALSLAWAYLGHGVLDRGMATGLHIAFAAYGFMGLLVLGFSYVLVPMFALADSAPQRHALASAAAAVVALALAAAAACGATVLWLPAIVVGMAALAGHVWLMHGCMRSGLRKRLGLSFVLVRLGWGALAASLAAALALKLDAGFARLPTLFGVLLIGGLLSLLLGMLSRIVPFLAATHAGAGRRAPLPSALTSQRALDVHFGCHLAALALLVAAVVADSAVLARLAGAVGAVGAVAFAAFFARACLRMRAAPAVAAVHRV